MTALAATATEKDAQGIVVAGMENGSMLLLVVHRNLSGVLESPLVVYNRQLSPRKRQLGAAVGSS